MPGIGPADHRHELLRPHRLRIRHADPQRERGAQFLDKCVPALHVNGSLAIEEEPAVQAGYFAAFRARADVDLRPTPESRFLARISNIVSAAIV